MSFTFPTDKADFTAPNGITYSWDARDDKWRVKTYKADQSALEDYVLTDDFIEDQDRQDQIIETLSGEFSIRRSYQLNHGVSGDGYFNTNSFTPSNVTTMFFGDLDAGGRALPALKAGDIIRVVNVSSSNTNDFEVTDVNPDNPSRFHVVAKTNIGAWNDKDNCSITFSGTSSSDSSLKQRVEDGEAKQAAIETTINTALATQQEIEAEQVVQNDDITRLQNKVNALEGSVIDAIWTFEEDDRIPRAGEFALRSGTDVVTGDWAAANQIIFNTVDFNGNTYTFEKVGVNDVIRCGAADGTGAEYRVTSVVGTGYFSVEHLKSSPDAADEQEYAFTFLSSFDPEGLATINYVDAQDDLKLNLSGGTLTNRLFFERGNAGANMVISPNAGDVNSSIYALNGGYIRMRSSLSEDLNNSVNTHITFGRNPDTNQPQTNIYHLQDPQEAAWAANKKYVDEQIAAIDIPEPNLDAYLPLTGGTLTGTTRITGASFFVNNASGEEVIRLQETGFIRSLDMIRVQRTGAGAAFQARIGSDANAEINCNGSAYFKGDIAMNGNKITGLADPTSNAQAATKKYVDDNAGAVVLHNADTPPNTASRGALVLTNANQLYIYVG